MTDAGKLTYALGEQDRLLRIDDVDNPILTRQFDEARDALDEARDALDEARDALDEAGDATLPPRAHENTPLATSVPISC